MRGKARSRTGHGTNSAAHAGLASLSPSGRPFRRPDSAAEAASLLRGLQHELRLLDLPTLRALLATHPDAHGSDVALAIDHEIRRRLAVPGLDS